MNSPAMQELNDAVKALTEVAQMAAARVVELRKELQASTDRESALRAQLKLARLNEETLREHLAAATKAGCAKGDPCCS